MKNFMAQNLVNLRKRFNLTQKELGTILASEEGRPSPYTVSAISAFELGRKEVTLNILVAMSSYFKISMDDLYKGLVTLKKKPEKTTFKFKEPGKTKLSRISILDSELMVIDGLPVYADFGNLQHMSQWALLDAPRRQIRLKSGETTSVELPGLVLYSADSYCEYLLNRKLHAIPRSNLDSHSEIYVSMNSSDPVVKAYYDGVYKLDNITQCLINTGNCNILPLTSYGVAYKAYAEPCD